MDILKNSIINNNNNNNNNNKTYYLEYLTRLGDIVITVFLIQSSHDVIISFINYFRKNSLRNKG